MTKVVFEKKLHTTPRRTAAIGTKRVRDADGKVHLLTTLDLGSDTLTNDLTYVFRKNVAKARRENKRLTGAADGVAAEG